MMAGKIIVEARKKKGWTQTDLAKRIGVKQPLVARWEKDQGIKLSDNTIAKLAKVLDIEEDMFRDNSVDDAPTALMKEMGMKRFDALPGPYQVQVLNFIKALHDCAQITKQFM